MKDIINLFSNVILIEGASRDCFYDLQMQDYILIPKVVGNIIRGSNGKHSLKELFGIYTVIEHQLKSYFDFFFSKDIMYLGEKESELFQKLDLQSYFSDFSSCIINFVTDSLKEDAIYKVISTGCDFFEIRILKKVSTQTLQNLLAFLENSNVRYINLVLAGDYYSYSNYTTFLSLGSKVGRVIIYDCKSSSEVGKVQKIDKKINDSNFDILLSKANINIKYFIEAHHFNTYFKNKIIIDNKGIIYSDEYLTQPRGHIMDASKDEILTDFNASISKDLIRVCRDCEFRYMCMDRRLVSEDSEGYYYNTSCGYDPYKATWDNRNEHIQNTNI